MSAPWPNCCGYPMIGHDARYWRCPECKREVPIPSAAAPSEPTRGETGVPSPSPSSAGYWLANARVHVQRMDASEHRDRAIQCLENVGKALRLAARVGAPAGEPEAIEAARQEGFLAGYRTSVPDALMWKYHYDVWRGNVRRAALSSVERAGEGI